VHLVKGVVAELVSRGEPDLRSLLRRSSHESGSSNWRTTCGLLKIMSLGSQMESWDTTFGPRSAVRAPQRIG
jgi:hypothetical protein